VDAQDESKKWFESKVVADRENNEEGNSGPQVQIHIFGQDKTKDFWLARNSKQLKPAYEKVKNFRFFKVGGLMSIVYC
jgi:hypothetical protein